MDAVQALLGDWTTETPDAAPFWRRELRPGRRSASSEPDPDDARIEQAIARLSAFAASWLPDQRPQSKSLGDRSPEGALAEALDHIYTPTLQPQPKGLGDAMQSARQELDAFVRRVRELVSHYAVIETTADGAPIARTVVSWTGDFQSLWRDGLTPEQVRLHKQNVRAALVRRAALIRLMGVIGASAARIALRLATPSGQLLVLPALWQFVRDVIEELQRAETRGVS